MSYQDTQKLNQEEYVVLYYQKYEEKENILPEIWLIK